MQRMLWLGIFLLTAPVASAQSGFQSPSGNIYCQQFEEGDLRCDIGQYSYRAPRPPRRCEGALGSGGSVGLTERGPAEMLCVSDTVADPGLPRLPYGRTWQGKGLSCASSESGVRCTNAAGRGFLLSRARLELF